MTKDFFHHLAAEFEIFLEPLVAVIDEPNKLRAYLRELGWPIADVLSDTQLESLVGPLDAIDDLVSAISETDAEGLEALVAGLGATGGLLSSLSSTGSPPAGITANIADLPRELVNALASEYLRRRSPVTLALLRLLTVAQRGEREFVESDGHLVRIRGAHPQIRLQRLADLIADPAAVFAEAYWPEGLPDQAAANTTALALFPKVAELLTAAGSFASDIDFVAGGGRTDLDGLSPSELEMLDSMATIAWRFTDDDAADHELGATVGIIPADSGGPGVLIAPEGEASSVMRLGSWLAAVDFSASGPGLQIAKSGVDLLGGQSSTSLTLEFAKPTDPGEIVIGSADGTHLAISEPSWFLRLDVSAAGYEAAIGIGVEDLALVLGFDSTDAFVQALVGSDTAQAGLSVKLIWTSTGGFSVEGSGGFVLSRPINTDLGVATLTSVSADLTIVGNKWPLSIGFGVAAKTGPLDVVIEDIGLTLEVSFPDGSRNLGIAQLDFKFKPPTGLGVSIDAGPVSGGGFVRYDPDRGRYSGMLQLKVFNVSVTAIGLLDTQDSQGNPLPDPGFSFLVIISVEFPPIQLGFGFTLSGIGGLLGIYRDSDYEALRAGLTTGSLDSVMFPEDPVANADKIINDLSTLFPTKVDSYIIGPMLLLGWGTPTLIRIEVGILIIFGGPVRVQILGQLSTELPSSDAALIKLNIDVIGEIDFGQGTLKIDATLRDSSLVGFPLTGDMVARARWKDDPMFGLSFGGFHPDYRPHAAFPKDIKRLALSIAEGSNLRIGAESYLAVTSNSVQFGARAELYAAAAGFSVKGDFEIHMLIIFDPFGFVAGVAMRVSLRFKGKSFASLGLEFVLSGPRPWRAKGKLKIKILFVTFKLKFNVSWGSSTPMLGPPIDVWSELRAALELDENWASVLPAAGVMDVLLLPRAEPNKVVVHPHGSLEMRQKVVPFDVPIDKFGSGRPSGDNLFEPPKVILPGTNGTATNPPRYLEDFFASGEYKDLAEDEKLSAPSFELMKSGIAFGSSSVAAGSSDVPDTTYETKIVGPDREQRDGSVLDSLVLAPGLVATLNQMSQAEEVRVSSLSASSYTVLGREPAISVKADRIKVLDEATGEAGSVAAPSWPIARDFLERVDGVPSLRDRSLLLINASERP